MTQYLFSRVTTNIRLVHKVVDKLWVLELHKIQAMKTPLYDQSESIAARYMTRFTIDEDDQFEIAAIRTVKRYNPDANEDFWERDGFMPGTLDEAS